MVDTDLLSENHAYYICICTHYMITCIHTHIYMHIGIHKQMYVKIVLAKQTKMSAFY